jgi:predicted GIY-YIG superfamily endonuclease
MDKQFYAKIETLHPTFERLRTSSPSCPSSLPKSMPEAGIYLFSEGDQHLYVGRSNCLRTRIRNHCRPGSTQHQAAFAIKLARKATGKTKASYKPDENGLKQLMENVAFKAAFAAAKQRISKMDVRFVAEADPTIQALLEMYAAVVLNTPFNDFDTH